jgi:hypothetical protein
MTRLTDEQKQEIVELLACFQPTSAIIRYFGSEHGISIDRKAVGRYDPTRPYYAAGDRWREVFHAKREAYLSEVATIPSAHMGYRLGQLQRCYVAASRAGNIRLAAKMLKQAAMEVGGVLIDQRR